MTFILQRSIIARRTVTSADEGGLFCSAGVSLMVAKARRLVVGLVLGTLAALEGSGGRAGAGAFVVAPRGGAGRVDRPAIWRHGAGSQRDMPSAVIMG
jgi:hypothetical protein